MLPSSKASSYESLFSIDKLPIEKKAACIRRVSQLILQLEKRAIPDVLRRRTTKVEQLH